MRLDSAVLRANDNIFLALLFVVGMNRDTFSAHPNDDVSERAVVGDGERFVEDIDFLECRSIADIEFPRSRGDAVVDEAAFERAPRLLWRLASFAGILCCWIQLALVELTGGEFDFAEVVFAS